MSNPIEDAVHALIDVVSGRKAHLPAAQADEMHEAITPGYNDKPLTDEEQAQLAALEERKARQAAAAKPKRKAAPADDEDDDGDEG